MFLKKNRFGISRPQSWIQPSLTEIDLFTNLELVRKLILITTCVEMQEDHMAEQDIGS